MLLFGKKHMTNSNEMGWKSSQNFWKMKSTREGFLSAFGTNALYEDTMKKIGGMWSGSEKSGIVCDVSKGFITNLYPQSEMNFIKTFKSIYNIPAKQIIYFEHRKKKIYLDKVCHLISQHFLNFYPS